MDWELAAQIAQVIATLLTGVGVIVSLWLGVRSLKELQSDRAERARPYLLFQMGPHFIGTQRREIWGIPGINPQYARSVLGSQAGKPSIVPRLKWGRLVNYGNGPALRTKVQIISYQVKIKGETFSIEPKKWEQPPYTLGLNTIPASPGNILPGEEASLFRIPTPIVTDFDRKLSELDCVIRLSCSDTLGVRHNFFQGSTFYVGEPENGDPEVRVTFRDELTPQDAIELLGGSSISQSMISRLGLGTVTPKQRKPLLASLKHVRRPST